MNFDKIELHDAQLVKIEISMGKIFIFMEYYPDERKSKDRTPIVLEFTDVQESNLLMDHAALLDNESAGNVVYWVPNEHGATSICLATGFIYIRSKTLNVLFPESVRPVHA